MQESLSELWDTWTKSGSENGFAIINRALIPQVNNALIFCFVAKKAIGVKDLGAALNSIWKPNSPATISVVGEGIYMDG